MVKENFAQQNFEFITCVKKNLCQNVGSKKFGSNNILVKKDRVPKNLDRKSLVKIGSETAEIFLYGEMLPGKMLPG